MKSFYVFSFDVCLYVLNAVDTSSIVIPDDVVASERAGLAAVRRDINSRRAVIDVRLDGRALQFPGDNLVQFELTRSNVSTVNIY
jgi:hypothetical protein